MQKEVVLAIETVTNSLALACEGIIFGFWKGSNKYSKTEDFLIGLNELILSKGLKRKDLRTIILAEETASLTAQRIIRSMALGIQKAVNCSIREFSILRALLFEASAEGKIQCVLQVNSRQFLRGLFLKKNAIIQVLQRPELLSEGELISKIIEAEFDECVIFCRDNSLGRYYLAENIFVIKKEEVITGLLVKSNYVSNSLT